MSKFQNRRAQFQSPPKSDIVGAASKTARYLLRFVVPGIWITVTLIIFFSLLLSEEGHRANSFQRSGNLVISAGLLFALLSFNRKKMMDLIREPLCKIFQAVEKDKNPSFNDAQALEIARLRVDRVLPELSSAVAKRLFTHEISVVILGTLIGGYGDLFYDAVISKI